MANNSPTKSQLEAQVSEQNKQIDSLLKKLAELEKNVAASPAEKPQKTNTKKTIKFVNMTVGGFTIQGTRTYRLEKQFDSRVFNEQEAKIIVSNMPSAVANGLLYVIADDDFMEECEISYDDIVAADTLKTLLDNNANSVVAIYQSACDEQKKIILEMIENKLLQGARIDANILVEIGNLCNRDLLKIEPMDE